VSYHKLLERQLKRVFGTSDSIPEELVPLLNAVSDAYNGMDDDRRSIERSLELMSRELTERNTQLRIELAEREVAKEALLKEQEEQAVLIDKLEDAHNQLLQSEKMASIGQLAAGVAHEINNPIGFVNSNCGTLSTYIQDIFSLIDIFEADIAIWDEATVQRVEDVKKRIDFAFLREDIFTLLKESAEGVHRVRKIVQDLKDFSHPDDGQWQQADLHRCLDSTINIVHNEVKYVADVVKEYGDMPDIQCLPFQLNQVFLNLLVNAGHAIKDGRGTITIRTGTECSSHVFVEIADNGVGIKEEDMKRIFDPFFTTKPIGKGTGLGLSVSYGIITKHNGDIEVQSHPGEGTNFRIRLPIAREEYE
jgi:two-component system NtrC family sensor kinase